MHHCRLYRNGISLIEILIGLIILSILAGIVVPMFSDYTKDAKLQTIVHNWKYAISAIRLYRISEGDYPPEANLGQYPCGLQETLSGMNWTGETPIGGHWDWDRDVSGVTAAVSINNPDWAVDRMAEIDAFLDDGNLSTGRFRCCGSGYMYVIEE